MNNKVLIVVDMQNDFISGSLGSSEAVKIVPNVCNYLKSFKGHVLFTQDTHSQSYSDTLEGKNLPIKHCIKGSEGWKICKELQPFINNNVVEKSSFGSFELIEELKKINENDPISEIVFVGLCTDICVITNVLIMKTAFPEVPVTVESSCCAGITPESHINALKTMKMCQINVQ